MQGKRRISYIAELIQWVIWNLTAVTHQHVLFQFLCFTLLIPPLLHLSPFPCISFLYFFLSPPLCFSLLPLSHLSPGFLFSLCFFPLPFFHPFLSSFPCTPLPLSSPFDPSDFYFSSISSSLPFYLSFATSIFGFWTKNCPAQGSARLSARQANSTDANPPAPLSREIPCMDTVMQLHRWLKSLGNRDLKIRHCPSSPARIPQRAGANVRVRAQGMSYAEPGRVVVLSQGLGRWKREAWGISRKARASKALPPGWELSWKPLAKQVPFNPLVWGQSKPDTKSEGVTHILLPKEGGETHPPASADKIIIWFLHR